MIQKIFAPISVTLVFDHRDRQVAPTRVIWEGREYPIIKIGLHHTYYSGRTLYHVFSAVSQSLFFKLVLNTSTLHWTLEEIADDSAN
jgi:hypothetical protein